MKNLLLFTFTVILILISHTINAETYLQLHTISYHSSRTTNFNENNYGAGLRHYVKNEKFDYMTIGAYKNSEFKTSLYSGVGWEWVKSDLKFGISAGLISGYKISPIIPYVLSNIRYKQLSLIISPFFEPVIHLTIDVMKF